MITNGLSDCISNEFEICYLCGENIQKEIVEKFKLFSGRWVSLSPKCYSVYIKSIKTYRDKISNTAKTDPDNRKAIPFQSLEANGQASLGLSEDNGRCN